MPADNSQEKKAKDKKLSGRSIVPEIDASEAEHAKPKLSPSNLRPKRCLLGAVIKRIESLSALTLIMITQGHVNSRKSITGKG